MKRHTSSTAPLMPMSIVGTGIIRAHRLAHWSIARGSRSELPTQRHSHIPGPDREPAQVRGPLSGCLVMEAMATRFISTSGPLQQSWSLLREGLRGSNARLHRGHVGHAVIVLAIPMVHGDVHGVALRGRRRVLRVAAGRRRRWRRWGSPSRCSPSCIRWRWGCASARRRWWRAASARRTPKARRSRRCR